MTTATESRRDWATQPNSNLSTSHWLYAGYYDPYFVTAVGDELQRLSKLTNNWDGYGAPPLDKNIIDVACQFIKKLPENLACRPRVVPMAPGNLQFEWHHGRKVLELEFEDPQTIHFLQWDPAADVEEEDSFPASDIARAVGLIQWFTSGTLA